MKTLDKHIGLDVHQDTTLSAMAQPGREWEVRPGLTASAVASPPIQNA